MEIAVQVAQLVASIAITTLCVFLVMMLIRLREKVDRIERDIKVVTDRTTPILENIDYITDRIKSIADNIDDQVMIVRDSIGSIQEVAENIVGLERKVQDRIEGPILDTVSFIAAVFKGVKTFAERLRA